MTRIAIVCEDHAHRALATFLADRVVLDAAIQSGAAWVEDSLVYLRT